MKMLIRVDVEHRFSISTLIRFISSNQLIIIPNQSIELSSIFFNHKL